MGLIRVADFAPTPGTRFEKDGPYSGEWFRESVLVPKLEEALKSNGVVTVELSGVAGYGSSFLEEAFGGLIRRGLFTPLQLQKSLRVTANRPLFESYRLLVEKYMAAARRESVAA